MTTAEQIYERIKKMPESALQDISRFIESLDWDESEATTRDLMLASEAVLAKDWLNPEEDKAWQHL
ncbi:MAG: DUF2281 domain-containing protein [Synechococcaceae cyanobacterium SM2_3_2]|nr:DUF2281 domain-containing protein [Synechococcaceae cyanobacterium SM2_3_2]